MRDLVERQLTLNVDLRPEAQISDFYGEPWTPVLDAIRQMSMGLLERCYFYGDIESGKSHLLNALCALYKDMGKSAICLSLKELVHEPTSILTDIETFELIALDDIQYIAGNAEWQEAVFHLLNRSFEGKCQLAFSADVAVTDLKFDLSDLVSRIAQSASYLLPVEQFIDERKVTVTNILKRRNLMFNANIIHYLVHHGPSKTSLIIAAVDELQQLSPEINHKRLNKDIKNTAIDIVSRYAAADT